MKFGTLLAREKVITPEQLEDALKNQVVYGGRLGTILLTLGHHRYRDAQAPSVPAFRCPVRQPVRSRGRSARSHRTNPLRSRPEAQRPPDQDRRAKAPPRHGQPARSHGPDDLVPHRPDGRPIRRPGDRPRVLSGAELLEFPPRTTTRASPKWSASPSSAGESRTGPVQSDSGPAPAGIAPQAQRTSLGRPDGPLLLENAIEQMDAAPDRPGSG